MRSHLGHIVFELTEACNQNCRFCYNHWRPDGCAPADPKLARKTLKRLLGQAKVDSFAFSGGEPMLLKNNVADFALTCRFAGSGVNVLTNGTLLKEDDLLNFRDIGVAAVQIPLLSSAPSVHDSLTCLSGSWEKAVASIRNAVSILGGSKVATVLILTAENLDTLPQTLEFYAKLGVHTVMVNRFNLGGNGLKNSEALMLTRAQLKEAFKTVSDFALAHKQMRFVSGVCTPLCVLDSRDYPGVVFTSCSTDVSSRPLAVSYKGDVRFCNHSPFVLGNIWDRPIGDILSDGANKNRYETVPEQCRDCSLYSRCKGGCRAASEQVSGSFDKVDPIINSI